MDSNTNTWLVMPLYIYPLTETTWGPLYDIIAAHPDVSFLVIVNPNSGPGGSDLPGRDYEREVPKLNSYANVCTVGYVRIDWCRRPLKESYEDIQLYAEWNNKHIRGLYVEGIYVDETPNHVSKESAEYLDAITSFIKNSEGLAGDRLVVHNPGTPPEGDLKHFGQPDLVCVCEVPHSQFCGPVVKRLLHDYSVSRDRTIYQISGINQQDITKVVQELCQKAKYVFATDLVDDFYESFGPSWADFVAAVRESNLGQCVQQAER